MAASVVSTFLQDIHEALQIGVHVRLWLLD